MSPRCRGPRPVSYARRACSLSCSASRVQPPPAQCNKAFTLARRREAAPCVCGVGGPGVCGRAGAMRERESCGPVSVPCELDEGRSGSGRESTSPSESVFFGSRPETGETPSGVWGIQSQRVLGSRAPAGLAVRPRWDVPGVPGGAEPSVESPRAPVSATARGRARLAPAPPPGDALQSPATADHRAPRPRSLGGSVTAGRPGLCPRRPGPGGGRSRGPPSRPRSVHGARGWRPEPRRRSVPPGPAARSPDSGACIRAAPRARGRGRGRRATPPYEGV